jgi:pentapeptide repeat protein
VQQEPTQQERRKRIITQGLRLCGWGSIFAGAVLLCLFLWKRGVNLDRAPLFAVGAGLLAVLLALVFSLPKRLAALDLKGSEQRNLSAAEYLEAVNHRRSALLTALGGVLLLASAFFTWSQIQVAREGQVTDRFTKAVDQLGSKDRHVRLGGIHALARTSSDSKRDRDAITDVLTAYVRGHAHWPGTPQIVTAQKRLRGTAGKSKEGKERCPPKPTLDELDALPLLEVRDSDLQAAITVIGRRPHSETERHGPSLVQVDGRYANFALANLEDAYFNGSNLAGANFYRANLDGADFDDDTGSYCAVRLDYANFKSASLEDANLTNVRLEEASFEGANLRNATLDAATLNGSLLVQGGR